MPAPYIPDSYTTAEPIVREIAEQVVHIDQKAKGSIAAITAAVSALSNLASAYPQGYLETVQLIKQNVAATPDDPAWKDLDEKLDKIIQDYLALSTRLQAVEAAIAAV